MIVAWRAGVWWLNSGRESTQSIIMLQYLIHALDLIAEKIVALSRQPFFSIRLRLGPLSSAGPLLNR